MIEPNLPGLSVGKQCALLSISRSSFYYEPKGETGMNLDLMRLIDKQFLETPFYGVRQMTWHLRNEEHLVNEKRIRRLMRLMGLMPIYQKPNTSKAAKGHKIYPYLLRSLQVGRPNQVWCADITYLPMRRGFLYLVAIMDWHSRKVLAWRISNTLEAGFCVDALQRSDPQIRLARDQEYGSGQPVHIVCVDRSATAIWRAHLDGRQGPLSGQHLCRTTMAIPKIRMRLFARLGNWIRGQGWRQKMDRVLQSQTPTFCTWRQTTCRGLLADK